MQYSDSLVLRQKIHDMILYLYRVMAHAPKYEKFTSQTQAKNLAFEFEKTVLRANKSTSKKSHLYEADIQLEQLREIIDIMHELEFIKSPQQYKHLAEMLDEIGRLLGGLIKFAQQQK